MTKWDRALREQAQERYERLDAVLAEMRGDVHTHQSPGPSNKEQRHEVHEPIATRSRSRLTPPCRSSA